MGASNPLPFGPSCRDPRLPAPPLVSGCPYAACALRWKRRPCPPFAGVSRRDGPFGTQKRNLDMQNLVILAGNVGATPEARPTQCGTKITHFSLATPRPQRGSNGKAVKETGRAHVSTPVSHARLARRLRFGTKELYAR